MRSIRVLTSAAAAVIFLSLLTPGAVPAEDRSPADLLLLHGRIYTSDPGTPWVEALAVRGGVIQAMGADRQIERYRGPHTGVIDLGGRMAMPGIIDSHTHFLQGSRGLSWAHLDGVRSPGEMKERIRGYAAGHPQESWIRGAGWTYDVPYPSGLPARELLDEAVPDRPAVMESCDMHSYWVNSRALEMAKITRDTPDPRENGTVTGRIVRDPKTGEPTGVLKEAAMVLMRNVMPEPSKEDDLASLRNGMAYANRHGVTTVVNASGDIREMELYDELHRRGELTLRIKAAMGEIAGARHRLTPETMAAFEETRRRFRDDWVMTGLIKFFLDGVVETHTAAMLKPYSDDPSQSGGTNYSKEEFDAIVTELDRRGLQVMTHAIGDAAVRMALDAYGAAEKKNGPRDRRFRIEHIEVLDPADLPRFGGQGVIASMQPLHFAGGADSEQWRRNIGPGRLQEGFVWYDLASAGGRPVFGSDWPIVTIDAFQSMQTAVTRQTVEGDPEGGWFPAQRLSLDQALSGYTCRAAYAAFLEDRTGTIGPGKLADIIVLSQNLFEIPARDIGKTKVMLTMVNGKVVWRDGI
ncbi:MAG: amidohydrolase family protein [Candidatus Omnitrophota bacterium]